MIQGIRLDKWLWAARFYKTRALAAAAITGGKVRVNGERPKRARTLIIGDHVRMRRGPYEMEVVVRGLSEHRAGAARAPEWYEETAASRRVREDLAARWRAQPVVAYQGKGRPTKKDRRALDRWRADRHGGA